MSTSPQRGRRRVPLNAIRTFEAVARHQSAQRAAQELCVTPAAVSHQLRRLEDFLQIPLVGRNGRCLQLTAEAHGMLSRLTLALDLIDRSVCDVTGSRAPGGLWSERARDLAEGRSA